METVKININDILTHPDCPNVRAEISDNDVDELRQSIQDRGLKQPIGVFKLPDAEGKDKVYLIFGARRLRVFKMLAEKDKKYNEIDCIVYEYSGNTEKVIEGALLDNMIENLQRENVNILDVANRLKWLRDVKKMDVFRIAQSVGKSKAWFDQTIKLLEMPDETKAKLRNGEIGLSEARNIARLPKEVQNETAAALADAKKGGDKKKAKKLKEAIVEAGKVRSTSMISSKKEIERNRNTLISVMTAMKSEQKKGAWDEKDQKIYNVLQGSLDALNWVLGIQKEWGVHKLVQKYGLILDNEGNKLDPKKAAEDKAAKEAKEAKEAEKAKKAEKEDKPAKESKKSKKSDKTED